MKRLHNGLKGFARGWCYFWNAFGGRTLAFIIGFVVAAKVFAMLTFIFNELVKLAWRHTCFINC